jgi:hypothetical protein
MACVLALDAISVVAILWSGALPESLARFSGRAPAEHSSDVDLVDADHTM